MSKLSIISTQFTLSGYGEISDFAWRVGLSLKEKETIAQWASLVHPTSDPNICSGAFRVAGFPDTVIALGVFWGHDTDTFTFHGRWVGLDKLGEAIAGLTVEINAALDSSLREQQEQTKRWEQEQLQIAQEREAYESFLAKNAGLILECRSLATNRLALRNSVRVARTAGSKGETADRKKSFAHHYVNGSIEMESALRIVHEFGYKTLGEIRNMAIAGYTPRFTAQQFIDDVVVLKQIGAIGVRIEWIQQTLQARNVKNNKEVVSFIQRLGLGLN